MNNNHKDKQYYGININFTWSTLPQTLNVLWTPITVENIHCVKLIMSLDVLGSYNLQVIIGL